MADSAHTTRRTFLKALGFAAAGATVSTVAVGATAQPLLVKVASPSFSVPPDVMAAIQRWRSADVRFRDLYREVVGSPLPPHREHEANEAERALSRAQGDLNEAHRAMLRALRT